MWKQALSIPGLLAILIALSGLAAAGPNATLPGRWSEEKANAWYDEQPWLVGCNFTPSTAINQLEMWQADTFDPETIDRELGWAAGIGMNTIRVYLHDMLWQQDSEGFLERIDRFLGIADKHGITTMFVLFDSCWRSFPELGKQPDPVPHRHNSGWVQSPNFNTLKDVTKHKSLKPYVTGVIGRFKDDPRVLCWDLYNEPGNGKSDDGIRRRRKEAICLILLEHALEWSREVNPTQPLTVGGLFTGEWIGPKSTRITEFILANSDVISFHNYEELPKTIERVGSIRPFGRPLLCTEYLARSVGSRFETHLPYFKENRIAAYNWGLVAGKIQTQYPWAFMGKNLTAEPELWHHDVLKPDGTPHIASEVDLLRSLTAESSK